MTAVLPPVEHFDTQLLKANWSDFLLSQCVRKLSLHSVLLFFSNEGDFSYRVVTIERSLAVEKVRLSASGATCIM